MGVRAADGTVIGGQLAADANVVSGFPNGLWLVGDVLVEHDLIGTNAAGTAAIGNNAGVDAQSSVHIVDSVVSGNTDDGIIGSGFTVEGSKIGTNADGTAAVPNGGVGVVGAAVVGGVRPIGSQSCTEPCNLISGNQTGAIIGLSTTVQGNFIGTNLDGTSAIPNGGYWATAEGREQFATHGFQDTTSAVSVKLLGGPSRAVQGICDQSCNLIAGNAQVAAELVPDEMMEGNVVGRSIAGQPLPNKGAAVEITHGDRQAIIGGEGALGNLIADNLGPAIDVPSWFNQTASPVAPTIEGNAITGNTGGVVYERGTQAPDAPHEVRVTFGRNGSYTFFGEIPDFFKGTAYARTIEIFGDKDCEPGPQGAVPLGTFTMGSSSPNFAFTVDGVSLTLRFFTMTDTYEGSTSTFSTCAS
jgi:hypothetical protein